MARAPAYVLGRVGLLLLGSGTLFAVGVIFLTAGLLLEAAATVAVKAVKMSAKLIARSPGTATGASS